MSTIDLDAQAANAGARAFGPGLILCPDCGHGIDPHGSDPGGPCGVGGCPCLMQPNGIACLIVDEWEAQVARVRDLVADGGDYHYDMHERDGSEWVSEGSPCVSVDDLLHALDGDA